MSIKNKGGHYRRTVATHGRKSGHWLTQYANSGFAEINDQDYVDKTLLINLINKTVEKKNKLTCISRPRRFGKSYAAKMLTAYYDCTCDSRPLFADKKISQTPDYAKYLNQYNVICLE